MISIVINSFNEPELLERAISSVLKNNIKNKYELVIAAPDLESEKVIKKFQRKNKNIRYFKDPGKGKSYALNLIFKELKGEIWIFTDGDVFIGENSINEVLKYFEDHLVGCVIGRPVSLNSKYFKTSFIEFSPIKTSPSVNIQISPFNSLNIKFRA